MFRRELFRGQRDRRKIVMAERPDVQPGDWIRVGETDCVVANVYPARSAFGDCEVVFNPENPTNHDVDWDGEQWVLAHRPHFGGDAKRYDRLRKFVALLKAGPRDDVAVSG